MTNDRLYDAIRPNTHDPMFFTPVLPGECDLVIRSLKVTKQDINSVPVDLFKKYCHIYLPTICNIINLCFESGIFPDCLKYATVIPIFKKR